MLPQSYLPSPQICKIFLEKGLLISFLCMLSVSTCVRVYHVHAVFMEARRGCHTPWVWSYGELGTVLWVLRVKPRSSARVAMLFTSEPSLQPRSYSSTSLSSCSRERFEKSFSVGRAAWWSEGPKPSLQQCLPKSLGPSLRSIYCHTEFIKNLVPIITWALG